MTLRELLFGKPKSPLDPHVFEKLALAAFLAWVGLGADGLSSSCYGPEELFKELGPHRALAPFLIIAIIVTVAVLTAGYNNTIEAYPGGGGAYIVATKTLGRYPGLLCGCALIVDYALTIAISMASGVEAIFSFNVLKGARPYHLWVTVGVMVVLLVLNLRGLKESIKILLPIFIGFLVTHVLAIGMALFTGMSGAGAAFSTAAEEAGRIQSSQGWWGLAAVLIGAYTVGAGTYTGIEAISNTVPILREPRVATAKRAMLYMAISLAFTSGGLILGYLLFNAVPEKGRTLNAVFLENLTAGTPFAGWFVPLTLLTEGLLLFVAAQAGYVDGPRVLASMAVDSWVPRWFRRLSDQLTISNGILLVGGGAVGAVILTNGSVKTLMIIYAFSVFVTFLLSQLGMCVHHLKVREPSWPVRLVVNSLAFLLSAIVVVSMLVLHLKEGVCASAAVIAVLMGLGVWIRHYYSKVGGHLGRLEQIRVQVESEPARGAAAARDPNAPTAAVLVRGYNGAGVHTLLSILRLFPNHFRNFVFLSVGEIDFDRFKGTHEVEKLRESVEADLLRYVALVGKWGYHGESRCGLGVDVVEESVKLCPPVIKEFPRAMFFAGQLLFEQPTLLTRLLHEQPGEELQRRLQFDGLAVFMVPIRVMKPRAA